MMRHETLKIRTTLLNNGWFTDGGAYVLVDGQYGSTGKGLLASVFAEAVGNNIDTVTTNAGPNSGHTAYHWETDEKVVSLQIPVSSIMMGISGMPHTCYLNAGAVIDPEILDREVRLKFDETVVRYEVHPNAAYVQPQHKGDQHTDIASTGKGVGPAMIEKLLRHKEAVIKSTSGTYPYKRANIVSLTQHRNMKAMGRIFVETAQGYSLGINSGFYPYTTSRECTVSQALADLGAPPSLHRKTIVSLRTFPIRVGNTKTGYSGPCYHDQKELEWGELGQTPEVTTVTGRIRRIYTWSWQQFEDMLEANAPDALFLNFLNYLDTEIDQKVFMDKVRRRYKMKMGRYPDFILGGFGPKNHDVRII